MTMTALALSPQQQAAKDWVRKSTGNLIVKAVAGAGKTTLLIEMLAETQGTVVFCAYNKSISKEIAARVAPLGLQSRVHTGTVHSLGFAALKASFRKARLDDRKMYNLAEDTIKEQSIRHFCVSAARMAKQLGFGLDPKFSWGDMIEHFSLFELLPEDASLMEAVKETERLLTRSNAMLERSFDYDDMIYGPLIRNLPFKKYDWVFLDEAQDTNCVRRLMVRKMMKANARMVAVGDECQAIYAFTGADHDSLQNIEAEFNTASLPLTVTYRCPKAIVKAANRWVSHIEAHETAPEGVVDRLTLEKAIAKGEFSKEDAVLCRTTKPLIELAYRLIRNGTACRVEGRAIGEGLVKLASRWKRVRTVGQLEEKLLEWQGTEMQKAQDRGNLDRCATVEDQVGTLLVLIENCDSKDPIRVLIQNIRDLFSDEDGNTKQVLTLSTIHKAKGREWNRVFALDMDRLSPSRWARKDWEIVQERNLCYVQVTRAKKHLTMLTSA